MASSTEQFPDQVWYDANNPGSLHDALRTDYARAKAAVERRPSLRRHMEACPVCLSIGAGTAAAPNPVTSRKRIKLALTKEQMHVLLRLPANFEIVHIYADNDPNRVFVLVAGEGLPEVPDNEATPFAQLGSTTGLSLGPDT